MALEYVHQELGKEVTFLAGYYIPYEELKLEHDGREVLCVTGVSAIESSCCGASGCAYAIVPGYILKWKFKQNQAGLPISEVEPVKDNADRQQIAAVLKERHHVGSIDFW